MTSPQDKSKQPAQLPLAELARNYFQRQIAIATQDASMIEPSEEVVPFDASALPPLDAVRAWDEARAALAHFKMEPAPKWQAPADWGALVASCESMAAVPLAIGNTPQFVRNVQPLLRGEDLATLRSGSGRPASAPALLAWVEKIKTKAWSPEVILALAALRVGRHFDTAAELASQYRNDVPAPWLAFWVNEEAALAWHHGQTAQALSQWEDQESSAPVHFNLGMAQLFQNRPVEAKTHLAQAVGFLQESDVWHHLGCLYLALADLRAS
jgi:hypothetical protein